jgi:hypothetical protein
MAGRAGAWRALPIVLALLGCSTPAAPARESPAAGVPLAVGFRPTRIASPDPARCALFHAQILGLSIQEKNGARRIGDGAASLRIEAGAPRGALELDVADVDALLVALTVRGIPFELRTAERVAYVDPDGRTVIAAEVTGGR